MLENTEQNYGIVAKSLHWLIAVWMIGMLIMGLWMTGLPQVPDTFKIYGWHKASGMLLLAAVVLRLWWRARNVLPRLIGVENVWQVRAAHAAHRVFYVWMLLMPLSGWVMSSAFGFPVSMFGLVQLPNLVSPNKELGEFFAEVHEWTAYALIATILLHIAAALWHHYVHKDETLRRMWFAR